MPIPTRLTAVAVAVLASCLAVAVFLPGEVAESAKAAPTAVSGDQVRAKVESVAAKRADESLLLLKGATFDPLRETFGPTFAGATLSAKAYPEGTNSYFIVQFNGRIKPEWREGVLTAGCEIVGYLPNNAYIVKVPVDQVELLADAPYVRWIGPYAPAFKFVPELSKFTPEPEYGEDIVRLRVTTFRDEDIDDVLPKIKAVDNSVSVVHVIHALEVAKFDAVVLDVAAANVGAIVASIAAIPEVEWVEKFPVHKLLNDNSTGIIQGGQVGVTPLFNRGLTGFGQIYGAADSGLDTDACQFRFSDDPVAQTFANYTSPPDTNVTNPANKVIAYYVMPYAEAYDDDFMHGTFTTGNAVGDNYATLATRSRPGHDAADGMAPAARVVFQDIGSPYYSGLVGLVVGQQLMQQQAYDSGVSTHNNSYGSYYYFSDYTSESRDVDEVTWRLTGYNIVFSAGNSGPWAFTVSDGAQVAKNTITVGSTVNGSEGAEDLSSSSSHGPTADARIKPDVCAPGEVTSATEGDPLGLTGGILVSRTDPPNGNCDTKFGTGTSFSAPTVAGGALLVRQYFMDGYYPTGASVPQDGFVPTNALVKGILINSGHNMTGKFTANDGSGGASGGMPNFGQGWGRITLDDSLYFDGDARELIVLNDVPNGTPAQGFVPTRTVRTPAIGAGETHSFTLENVSSTEGLRISLVWSDPAGSAGAGVALVNNLDLTVYAPSGDVYRGNVNLANGVSLPAGDKPADNLNNVECVYIQMPEDGNYTVTVRGTDVPGNGQSVPFLSWHQGYALIATGGFNRGVGPFVSFLRSKVSGGYDGDNFLDPGETVNLLVTVQNTGLAASTRTIVTVRPSLLSTVPSSLLKMAVESTDLGPVVAGGTATGILAVELESVDIDYGGKVAFFDVEVDFGAGMTTKSIFSVQLARDETTRLYFDFEGEDVLDGWKLYQYGEGADDPPGVVGCDDTGPPERTRPNVLKFGAQDCVSMYSNNDDQVAISPAFAVPANENLVSLNFFLRYNTEYGWKEEYVYYPDAGRMYVDNNGDGYFVPAVALVGIASGSGGEELFPVSLGLERFEEGRGELMRVGLAFESDDTLTETYGMSIDDISVTTWSIDLGPGQEPVPVVSSIFPSEGPQTGATEVTVRGLNFAPDAELLIGDSSATDVTVRSDLEITEITGVTPPGIPGRADVVVKNPDSGFSGTLTEGFEYIAVREDLIFLTVAQVTGSPGSLNVRVPISVHSPLSGGRPSELTFEVGFNDTILTAKRVELGDAARAAGKTVVVNVEQPGVAGVEVRTDESNTTPIEDGVVAVLVFGISEDAEPDPNGPEVLSCAEATGSNEAGLPLQIECENGQIEIVLATCDMDGDGDVDAIDVQRVINVALGIDPYSPVADTDSDGDVDAVDLQKCINLALNISS